MPTVAPHDYERQGVDRLTSYISKDATLYDRHGREMDGKDVQELIDYSEHHQMSRHIVLSPENADNLTYEQMHQMAKRTLRDTIGRREDVEYAFGIHTDGGDRDHVHVAATGPANHEGDSFHLDGGDLANIRETTHFHAKEAEHSRVLDHAAEDSRGKSSKAERTKRNTKDVLRELETRAEKRREKRMDEALEEQRGERQQVLEEMAKTSPPWKRIPAEEAEEEEEKDRDHGYGLS